MDVPNCHTIEPGVIATAAKESQSMNRDEIQRKLEIIATPVDIDTYIEQGLLSRYKQTKSKFIVHGDHKELPEDINLRTTALETINSKESGSQLVITLNLKDGK